MVLVLFKIIDMICGLLKMLMIETYIIIEYFKNLSDLKSVVI